MALNERRIAVVRGALKGHVHSSLELVATLTESAKTEKDPSNGVHVKLLHAQKKMAEQKRRLARLNAEHPVFIGLNSAHARRG
jgi:hypothetical protein